MCNSYYKLTNESEEVYGRTVYRIEATEDFTVLGLQVKKGDRGGLIQSKKNLYDGGWVADEAVVLDTSVVREGSLVSGSSKILGSSIICDRSTVTDYASIRDSYVSSGSTVSEDSYIKASKVTLGSKISDGADLHNSHIKYHTTITGLSSVYNSQISGSFISVDGTILDAVISTGSAEILNTVHYLSVDTFTSSEIKATLYRTKDGGHAIDMGCWNGTVDELEELFKKESWIETGEIEADEARDEMLAMCSMFRSRIKRWENL